MSETTETCECGCNLEYITNEWAKYPFSDSEELIDIYECTDEKCKRLYESRRDDSELVEIED